MPQELHLRTPMIAMGTLLLIVWCGSELRGRKGLPPWPRPELLKRIDTLASRHYGAGLALILGGFLLLSTLAKISQLEALDLSAEDFWLFKDMLAQMARGGFFLTRFAPQAVGWVQHGAVHAYFSWALALPITWLAGPLVAALSWNPLMLTGAAAALGAITRPRWGALGALMAVAAFLASNQIDRILMYEVHPEAAYPLGVLLWAWAAGWGDGRLRPVRLLAATVFAMGIKSDSFLVLPPLMLSTALLPAGAPAELRRRRAWLAASGATALAVTFAHFFAVSHWASGAWGPHQWQGHDVVLPPGPAMLGGRHLDGAAGTARIARELIAQRGGLAQVILGFVRFLLSRPWLSLLVVAPWVVIDARFWIAVLSLAATYSVLEMPGKFITYYAAPVLGLFWLAAVCARPRRPGLPLWLLCASLVLGGSGIDFHFASPLVTEARSQATEAASCLPEHGSGLVTGRFLGLIPESRVLTDRIPAESLDGLDFCLFSIRLPSFEAPSPVAARLLERLKTDPHWVQLGKNCQPIAKNSSPVVLFFVRR